MKWLEIIKLRTAGINLEKRACDFIGLLTKNTQDHGLPAIQVYYHATLNTDLSIHIHWDTQQASRQKTLLGSCLANKLEEFGMIHHTIWITQIRSDQPSSDTGKKTFQSITKEI